MGHMIPINEITQKKLKFSLDVIPQRDRSNGVCVRFPQLDSIHVKPLPITKF